MNAMLSLCVNICDGSSQLGLHDAVTRDFSHEKQYKTLKSLPSASMICTYIMIRGPKLI